MFNNSGIVTVWRQVPLLTVKVASFSPNIVYTIAVSFAVLVMVLSKLHCHSVTPFFPSCEYKMVSATQPYFIAELNTADTVSAVLKFIAAGIAAFICGL